MKGYSFKEPRRFNSPSPLSVISSQSFRFPIRNRRQATAFRDVWSIHAPPMAGACAREHVWLLNLHRFTAADVGYSPG
jgi:hypothetical protein